VGPGAGLDRCRKSSPPPPTGIRSPDRSACSQSLYRLHYPAHEFNMVLTFYSGLTCCGYVTFKVSYCLILWSVHIVRKIGTFDQRVYNLERH
jgi:hypothetical protein